MIADKTYEPVQPLRLAFLGLGTMGAPMAAHLLKAGHHVTVYNRTRAKADAWLAELGNPPHARVANTPRDAAYGADIVLSCVGNDKDLAEVATGPEGGFLSMDRGTLWVDHTTTSAQIARDLAALGKVKGITFIDAPVSGGNLGAINGVLTVMCGGEQEAFDRAAPVLKAYARAVTRLGEPGAGQLAKMVNQICVAGVVQSLAEALAFGQKAGLDMHKVIEVISQGAASSWQMANRGPTMVDDRFDFGFAVDWMRKDLGLCFDEARRQGAALPVTEQIDAYYAEVQAMGGGRWDTSSLIRRLR
ncbi:MAG TPA: NAD(P)-dependent oxidoreductase [Candidatus Aquabacterium excrementipullorum]|nr:NAD(P)-dependent oxidoreductase [Candidatus Aquabacterium excrementipullorum]